MERENVNVVFCGRSQSGIATMLGQLVQILGGVDHHTVDALYIPNEDINVHQWVWNLWEGFNIDHRLSFENDDLLLLKEEPTFAGLNSVITGPSQADLAVYVIDVSELENVLTLERRTRLFLAFALCFQNMIVVLNKMDLCGYSHERFNLVVKKLCGYLRRVGLDADKITFLPVSSLIGDNIHNPSNNMPWFHGNSLIWTLDHAMTKRLSRMPLRIPIDDAFKRGYAMMFCKGHVLTGVMEAGKRLNFGRYQIRGAEVSELASERGDLLDQAGPSSSVHFLARRQDHRLICQGDLASYDACSRTMSFRARLLVLHNPTQIGTGFQARLAAHMDKNICCITQIYSKKQVVSAFIETNPIYVKSGEIATVQIVSNRPMVLEKFTEFPKLGRFTLRDGLNILAVGIVEKVEDLNVNGIAGPLREVGCGFQEGSSVKSTNKKVDREQLVCASGSSRLLREIPYPPSIVLGRKEKVDCIRRKQKMFGDEENTQPNNNNVIKSSYKKMNKVKRYAMLWEKACGQGQDKDKD